MHAGFDSSVIRDFPHVPEWQGRAAEAQPFLGPLWGITYGVCTPGRGEAALLWTHSNPGSPMAEAKAAPMSRITWLPAPPKKLWSPDASQPLGPWLANHRVGRPGYGRWVTWTQ